MGIREWFRRTFDPGAEALDALARLDAVLETMGDIRMVLRNADVEVDGRSILESVRSLVRDRDEARRRANALAVDSDAAADKVHNLMADLDRVQREAAEYKEARAAAVQAEAELLVRCQRYRDRLAAIADAAAKPVD